MLLVWLTFLPILYASAALIRLNETVYDAAHIARRLLTASSVGTMATNYPADHPTLAGMPFSLQEYYASCYPNGSLLLLFLPISRHSKNILSSPEHAASISVWHLPYPSAEQARVSLIGKVTVLGNGGLVDQSHRKCYINLHPDARRWLPEEPDSPHLSLWARFDPVSIYFVGGFGDEHYIGEIPLHLYQDSMADQSTGRQESSVVDRLQCRVVCNIEYQAKMCLPCLDPCGTDISRAGTVFSVIEDLRCRQEAMDRKRRQDSKQ